MTLNKRLLLITGAPIVIVAFAAVCLFRNGPSARPRATPAREVDATALEPGKEIALQVGGLPVSVSVPDGEGFTYGTFRIRLEALGFDSGPLERDGSLEAVWVVDVNGDNREDGVFVIRSGGSGSAVAIIVLESATTGFKIITLPDYSAPDYLGHDRVSIRNGAIVRAFPTYIDDVRPRVSQQWTIRNGMRGESPLKARADANADPSGVTVEVTFDTATGRWKR